MGRAFSPLDRELELLQGEFSPTLVEHMVRLGARITFGPAAKEIFQFTRVDVSKPTVRRDAEKAGRAYVEVQTAQLEAIERDLPEASQGPDLQQLSVDGAMVPLVGGEWAEVKTLAIGTVGEPVLVKGEWEVHTGELSYFSRMTDHETFGRLATVETHRRGTESAGKVCAVNDGADWEQGFVDLHRPDAVRILDWGHATEHLSAGAQAVLGAGTAEVSEWLSVQLHELKHGDPEKVLLALRELRDSLLVHAGTGSGGEGAEGMNGAAEVFEVVAGREQSFKVVSQSLEYLEKRRDQIRYAEFIAAGYPIGSGAVESANKLVVEVRMKGAGMHWDRGHVDPMVALRDALCSDRWEEAWPQISHRLIQKGMERSARRPEPKGASETAQEPEGTPCAAAVPIGGASAKPARPEVEAAPSLVEPIPAARRPGADHPWRRMPIGRARYSASPASHSAET